MFAVLDVGAWIFRRLEAPGGSLGAWVGKSLLAFGCDEDWLGEFGKVCKSIDGEVWELVTRAFLVCYLLALFLSV